MILKILCCLIPELLHSQTWTAGHLSSGVTATPYQPFTAEGEKKKTTDNCGNLIATKATQGGFWCNLIQQEPVTFRNHCQLVRRFMFFPANQWLCHSQHGKQFSSNVRMMSSDASIEQLPKKPHINPSGANQLFTLKLGLQYFTCTVHTFTDSVYIF